MGFTGKWLLLLSALLAVGSEPLGACKQVPSPLIYERLTTGGRFAIVQTTSEDSLRSLPGFQLTSENRRILSTYPKSGLYRTEDLSQPILDLGRWFHPSAILGFFEYEESVYLIVQIGDEVRFYRDGTLVRQLGDAEAQEWITVPWHREVTSCGPSAGYEIRLDEGGGRPSVVVETQEGTEFRYDALTGRLLEAQRPELPAGAPAMPYERELAEIVDELLEVERREPREFWHLLRERADDFTFEGCDGLRPTNEEGDYEMDEEDEEEWESLAKLELQAFGLDVHGARRVKHRRDGRFDLYRPAGNDGLTLLCGRETSNPTELLDSLGEEAGTERFEAARTWLDGFFQSPTIITVTTLHDPEYPDARGGTATLWSRANGEWRIVGSRLFALPEER